ncbi:MAG: ABC transporter substrate-binding protein [Acetobacteraceae bacterium]|nr:ABC transporter substrate-binding protein [Acetobacteraceae bacterium]
MKRIKRRTVLTAVGASVGVGFARRARAVEEVKIGAVFPLSGNAAAIGQDARHALETMAEIINGRHNIPMLLGEGGGLSGLGGAKVKLLFADSQNNPQIARSAAERFITQDGVVAVIGSYTSATAVTISQICNRYQIPYISADNSSPSLNRQGLEWFFRPSPTDIDFTKAMFDFFAAIGEKTSEKVQSIAIIHENSVFGSDSAKLQARMAEAAGIKVLANISYQANIPSLSVEAERLRAADADVVMPSSYTSDAILLMRAMHDAGYKPRAIMAQDAGFIDPAFIAAVGPLAEGLLSRSAFAIDAVKQRPAIPAVNALFRTSGANKDLNDLTARELTALQVLGDALNRAKSTNTTALRAALRATDIPGNQTIMPWAGVKFDETGQNIKGNPVILQYQKGQWRAVFPFEIATAAADWHIKR